MILKEEYQEGMFDLYGQLLVYRGGRMVQLECPKSGFSAACRDSCPLLGEPQRNQHAVVLNLCCAVFRFGTFLDQRIK